MEQIDESLYQSQRTALGLSPDNHQKTLQSLLTPPKAKVSFAEQKIRDEVLREWEQRRENERLMALQYKCNKIQYYLW